MLLQIHFIIKFYKIIIKLINIYFELKQTQTVSNCPISRSPCCIGMHLLLIPCRIYVLICFFKYIAIYMKIKQ